MFDYKSEFLALIDHYPLSDGMTRLQLAQQLEDTFVERLQVVLINTLSEQDRNELFSKTEISPDEFFRFIYSHISDVDILVKETFDTFTAEFLENL